jgi:prepilin-type N-terminal cleavage/methylation domain-containing protein/prepilin-type processing-associated H-X9-DG protein
MQRIREAAKRGFTLIELLVVMAIVALLVAILLPSLAAARERGRLAVCLANLRGVGTGIRGYAVENGGAIPFGPKSPLMFTPANFYPCTGSPTSLLSLLDGKPVGLGLLLESHLSQQPKVLFCPSADQPEDATGQLAKVGTSQAQCSYYYRHGSNPNSSSSAPVPTNHLQVEYLGTNRNGVEIRALVMDTQFVCPPSLASFGVKPATHHEALNSNVLYADGHAAMQANTGGRFTVDLSNYNALMNAFDLILKALEKADETR